MTRLFLLCLVASVDGLSPTARVTSLKETVPRLETGVVAPFAKDFTRPQAVPEEGIEAAVAVMRSGRLFRYCTTSAEASQVSQAEAEFAAMVDQKYAVGVNSCSSAIMLALIACGVESGSQVITNGFTFTALPSTIMRLGAEPILVEMTPSWTMDVEDLEMKMDAFPDAKVLLLSHMRGKVTDMDKVAALCEARDIKLIEDCAHGCGVEWRGRPLGWNGIVSAYSTQSDKVINSGEGGFVTTNDDAIAARLIYLSGCYERRYGKHAVRPADDLCEDAMATQPNLSCRMSEVTAACVRPQIATLPKRVVQYNARYDAVVDVMRSEAGDVIVVPEQDERVSTVGDHLNFYLVGLDDHQNAVFRTTCVSLGVPVSWFRSAVNARWHVNWRKFGAPTFDLPVTDAQLKFAYDLKLPPHFDDADFPHLAAVIAHAANVAVGKAPPV